MRRTSRTKEAEDTRKVHHWREAGDTGRSWGQAGTSRRAEPRWEEVVGKQGGKVEVAGAVGRCTERR